uniref:Uncharacterized protein n=1 Tax=Romanomermis culicivorax TaxID=13658 RepID=A0A915KYM1_ROMCU
MLLLSWINLLLIFLLNIQTGAARSNIDLESAQEFVVLSTPYPMTDDPEEPPEHGRTTKIFRKKKPTPYAFMDYFTLNKSLLDSMHRADVISQREEHDVTSTIKICHHDIRIIRTGDDKKPCYHFRKYKTIKDLLSTRATVHRINWL